MDFHSTERYVLEVTVLLMEWNRVLVGTLVAPARPDLQQIIAQEQDTLINRLTALTPPDPLRRLHDDLVRMAVTSLEMKATGLDGWKNYAESASDFEEAVKPSMLSSIACASSIKRVRLINTPAPAPARRAVWAL